MYRCTLKVLYNACHGERYGGDSGERTIAEWPRCLVDLMPGSVGAERVAIVASVGGERKGRRERESPRRIDGLASPTNVDRAGTLGCPEWPLLPKREDYNI